MMKLASDVVLVLGCVSVLVMIVDNLFVGSFKLAVCVVIFEVFAKKIGFLYRGLDAILFKVGVKGC